MYIMYDILFKLLIMRNKILFIWQHMHELSL